MSKPKKNAARILIVDNHPAVREALAMRIDRQPDLRVCGEAADVSDALQLVASTRPDVAVVDISLRTGNGIDLIKRIKSRNEEIRILVWSMHSESLYAERALRNGALGYINKEEATEKIVAAIRSVLAGKIWLSDVMAQRLLKQNVGKNRAEATEPIVNSLADRELEVFQLIGAGLKTSEIADRLHLSVKTIDTYRDRIRHKLNLSDGAKLAQFAAQWILENS